MNESKTYIGYRLFGVSRFSSTRWYIDDRGEMTADKAKAKLFASKHQAEIQAPKYGITNKLVRVYRKVAT